MVERLSDNLQGKFGAKKAAAMAVHPLEWIDEIGRIGDYEIKTVADVFEEIALYYFDIGYLAESYKQWLEQDSNPARGIDGYALVKQALQLRGDDPQMEFAAALITLAGPASAHDQHAQKAKAGAKNDPLLARNLASHFMGQQGQTTAEVLTKPAASGASKP